MVENKNGEGEGEREVAAEETNMQTFHCSQ